MRTPNNYSSMSASSLPLPGSANINNTIIYPPNVNNTMASKTSSLMFSSDSIIPAPNSMLKPNMLSNHVSLNTNLNNSSMHTSTIDLQQQLHNSQFSNNSSLPVIPTLPALASSSQHSKSKKGVKRKADTTTSPHQTMLSDDDHKNNNLGGSKALKMSTRRESSRPIKKPPRELPDPLLSSSGQIHHSVNLQIHQSSGGSRPGKKSSRMRYCSNILKELFSKKHESYAWPFYKPVDVENLGLDDYLTIVKHPMDLGTAKSKMEKGAYRKPEEFAADIRLIFTNCYKYNPPEHEVVSMARKLQVSFDVC